MAAQPIPAAFAVGTEVTRITGYPQLKSTIRQGVVTRRTKTLADVTFHPENSPSYTRTFVFKPSYRVAEPYLSIQEAYSTGELDEVYLRDSQRVQDAHAENARKAAQHAVMTASDEFHRREARWVTREDVEAHIARLTAELDALPTRQTL